MKLFVTGATGFLGKHVVRTALERGHDVVALVRPASSNVPEVWGERVRTVRADLRGQILPGDALTGVDAVLHLAADKSGDLHPQLASTVVGTERLVQAMLKAGLRRIVLISSFSVYGYQDVPKWAVMDEDAPLESRPETRDAYCWTKLVQERYAQELASAGKLDLTVLRPGVIFGPGELWTARLGFKASPTVWVRTGADAPVPLTYVENCAEAVVMAAEVPAAIGATLNVVDDETPTQSELCDLLRARVHPTPKIVPVPFPLMSALAGSIGLVNRVAFLGRAKVPQIFNSPSLAARCKPLRYDNRRLKQTLGWQPRYNLERALERSRSSEP